MDDQTDIIQIVMAEFQDLQNWRALFAAQWEEIAALILPTSRNTFFFGSFNYPGMKKTDRQIDATGMLALDRFTAICDSLLTPKNMMWHGLGADTYIMKDRQSRLWFEEVTKRLFKYRYLVGSNFTAQNQRIFKSLGAFGNGGIIAEERFTNGQKEKGLRYINVPVGELFIHQNYQNVIDGFFRWYKLTARQAAQEFGYDSLPPALKTALDQHSSWPYNFLWRVMPNVSYDPLAIGPKNKMWSSHHVSIEGKQLMRPPGGYRSLPLVATRYLQEPGEVYGRSPAMSVLPALKTLNAEKTTFLRTGHRASDPVLLTVDEGLTNVNMMPGAINAGGMSSDGKPLIGVLPTGQIQITKEMMDEERQLINDSFLVSLFQILTETPQMTATEVIERVNEKGILLAPTVGQQEDEYLGPLIVRELDCLSHQGLLPPMPPRLKEAGGEFHVVYSSPLARARRAQEASGFMRTLQTIQETVQITGDVSLLHPFNFDTAIKEIARIQGVPESWMATQDEIDQKGQQLAQSQAQKQQIQAAPAAAAMMKAQAVASKAGVQPPGQQGPPGMGGPPQQQQPEPVQGAPPSGPPVGPSGPSASFAP